MIELLLVVAVALIDPEGRILLAQRPFGKSLEGMWELPGGKIEHYETPETALVRELKEELNILVQEDDLHPLTFASHNYPEVHLLMPVYLCNSWAGDPHGMEGQALAWVRPYDLNRYPMPPADMPLIDVLQKL